NRCNNNNENDNKNIIKKLVDLRLKKAQIMGAETSAGFILEDRMAKTPQAVYELLDQIWTHAIKVANSEANDMRNIIAKEKANIELEGWDWRFYAQKAMNSKFNLSESETAPYFKLENVREGIFYVANKLYGLTFKQLSNVPLPNPEAVAFEVKDSDSSHLGVVFFDMFARPGAKSGGAWCGGYRSQSYKDGKRVAPLVTIVGNFTRPIGD
ncbi:MAG: M3 family metallopeptidase, partial [Bacteroidales bacterium]